MLTPVMLHSASAFISRAGAGAVRPVFARLACSQPCRYQYRYLSQSPKDGKSRLPRRLNDEVLMPEAPPMSKEEIEYLKDFARNIDSKSGQIETVESESTDLPEAPSDAIEYDIDEEVEQDEEGEEIKAVPFSPFYMKSSMIPGINSSKGGKLVCASKAGELISTVDSSSTMSEVDTELPADALEIDPSMMPVLAAWARAVVPTPSDGPMPLHELANKSTQIKELVKLGVDFSKIVERHGDMERLLHLSWENQIKPHIRFLVDCGIDPDRLGNLFTCNTALLWTSIDDIQVRINYLEAKHFSADDIKNILNKAPLWLKLPTKEVDSRLGFLQRTFQLQGSEVRFITSTFPNVVSSKKWEVFVDSTKLLDREFGFTTGERKALLFQRPQCYLRPGTLRQAFNYCHNQIGLTHIQLVKHATLLVNRVHRIKPRHQFLKFLKRDNFNVSEPGYLSPDWLWKGTTEEFCKQAAKTTIEDYECYLKLSMY